MAAGASKQRTPQRLHRDIERYFASISRMVRQSEQQPLLDEEGLPVTDEKGKPLYRVVQLLNQLGEPLYREEYATPPTILGLCRYLGISQQQWQSYRQQEEYQQPVAAAYERIAQYLEEQLIENPKATKGIVMELDSYGCRSLGEHSDEESREPAMTLVEKLALIREMTENAASDLLTQEDGWQ